MREIARALMSTGEIDKIYYATLMEDEDVKSLDDMMQKVLLEKGLTEEDVYKAFAKYSNLEYLDITTLTIPAEDLSRVPSDICRANNILPIGHHDEYIFLATYDPSDIVVLDDVASMTGMIVAPKIVAPSVLHLAIDRYLRSDEELMALSEEIGADSVPMDDDEEEQVEDDDAPVVRFVDLLITQAIQDRASDIHVEPGADHLGVRFRIDGVLHEVQRADRSIQAGVISRLKIMSEIDIAEKRRPQDGRFSKVFKGKKIDIRVASLPTVWGEKIVMRILDHDEKRRTLAHMGMSEKDLDVLQRVFSKSHGMVLVTGPTGSGKSTTLYTALDEVANESVNVITVEDPVEKRIAGINQIQINARAGLTFPSALRSILRSDPDIVLIGEIRDAETATIAVEASLTGHLVLSTLHTNSAPAAITRLIEMGVEPYLVSSSISSVVAQRLARRLCAKCKMLKKIDPVTLEKVGFPKDKDGNFPDELYEAEGCPTCSNTGYLGRIAILEVMEVNEEIERLAIENAPVSKIEEVAINNGYTTKREDGFRNVLLGNTTIEEVLRVAA